MFQRVLRTWGRLVGRSPEPSGDDDDRRVWVRFPCDVEISCQPTKEAHRLSARVRDVSLGGMRLIAGYPFENGGLLSVELPGTEDGSRTTVLVYVVRVTSRANGEWDAGCTFATELSDEDLRLLGAERRKPAATDQRSWVRFPSEASVSYRRVRDLEEQAQPAKILNISPSGAGVLTSEAVDAGTLLSLELGSPNGNSTFTIMASVTRVTGKDGAEWVLGCSFIRELTDAELNALL
jgi:hypothetical protein